MRWAFLLMVVFSASCAQSPRNSVTIYAASSLTEAFAEIGDRFETHRGASVEFNFAGSQTLRLQIEHGAPADVFATADERHLSSLVKAGRVVSARPLVRNELVAVVPIDSPWKSFEDLARAERIVVGSEAVPVGGYTRRMLHELAVGGAAELAGQLSAAVVSEENNVRMVRSKVELGVADVGFVYRTDALASSRVRIIELPERVEQRAQYGIGLVGAPTASADAFVDFAMSAEAAEVFAQFGFEVTP